MKKREAWTEANRRWFTRGISPNDVVAYASRGRNAPRFRVGANTRNRVNVAHGESDESWEDAFADADAREASATKEPNNITQARLYDVFAGRVELTAPQRAYILRLMEDAYINGSGWMPDGITSREFYREVRLALIDPLKLERMVTPDGKRLVSVEEHDAIVAAKEKP